MEASLTLATRSVRRHIVDLTLGSQSNCTSDRSPYCTRHTSKVHTCIHVHVGGAAWGLGSDARSRADKRSDSVLSARLARRLGAPFRCLGSGCLLASINSLNVSMFHPDPYTLDVEEEREAKVRYNPRFLSLIDQKNPISNTV